MKKMKKMKAVVLTCAVCMCSVSMQAFAAEKSTDFTFEYKNDPSYTVSIPGDVSLSADGTDMSIQAENVANLDGKKVSVTIAGTSAYRNQMLLEGKTATGSNASVRYQFIMDDDRVIETTGAKDQVNGVELASFDKDGTETFVVKPVLVASSSLKKGVTYSGSMTYAIGLTDAE